MKRTTTAPTAEYWGSDAERQVDAATDRERRAVSETERRKARDERYDAEANAEVWHEARRDAKKTRRVIRRRNDDTTSTTTATGTMLKKNAVSQLKTAWNLK